MDCKNRKDIPAFLNLKGFGAEIGVLRGEFSEHILKNWEGEKLYLIDAWRHFKGVIDINNATPEGHGDNLLETLSKVYSYGERATLIRELSVEAAKFFPDGYFDFVYLDANHTHKSVIEDLNSWYPKVKVGGYIMGHDYLDCTMCIAGGKLFPTVFEVKSAVDQYAFVNNLSVVVISEIPYPSWYIKKEIEL